MARLAADSFSSEFVRTVTLYLQSREDST